MTFDYSFDFASIDFRKQPEHYRIGGNFLSDVEKGA
jgi:hypothetical protein